MNKAKPHKFVILKASIDDRKSLAFSHDQTIEDEELDRLTQLLESKKEELIELKTEFYEIKDSLTLGEKIDFTEIYLLPIKTTISKLERKINRIKGT